jgi:hypothetical protein
MSKERALLRKALAYLSGLPARTNIQDDIEAYLSAEPEANCYGDGNVYRGVRSKDSEVKTVYVKTAEPARKPMTEEEILELYNQCEEETSVHSTIFHFDKFARAIEARGIVLRPLNKKQIEKAFEDTGYAKGDSRGACFVAGIRFAEKHHGITNADL